ncbi:MAG: RlmE family RNA methyltransferase [Deltaproteobacteria bacterium]|nr:MAG: RlmE family RNA methyltransferase [Deltaproteobacteria bacterium]
MARHHNRRRNPYAKPDALTQAARAAGYTARSVFKLEQIDQRVRLLRQGQRVLDLGAAPGSWSAYAAKRIGPAGQLVAIDLKPLKQVLPDTCQVIIGDAFDGALLETGPMGELAPYSVVLSDMAPNTTGDKATDQIRSHQLFMRALELATTLLEPGGSFVGKLFMGGDFGEARDALRARFTTARTIRPKAVRDVSYEIYLVGLSLKDQSVPAS